MSKLASSLEDCRTRHITIHYLPEARTPLAVQPITTGEDWRTPIIKWIEEGLLPENRWEAARLKTRATRFIIQEHILYKKEIISDNGRQFQGRKIQEWCQGLRVKQRFTTVAHPQANGQVEVTNRILVQGIKRRLERVGGNWTEELTSVLWAYRTTPIGSTGETPFSPVYDTEAIIPAELGMPSHRVMNFSEECNENLLRENLDLIEELRKKPFTHTKIQEYHDQFLQQKSKIMKFPSGRFGATKGRRPEANRQARSYLGRTIQGHKHNRQRGLRAGRPRGRPLPRPWNVHNLKKYFA
ncbi:UNVERIFIED_CONTAM: hypothetical protein Slati_3475700 [Sesamum latifolium]|uniref:Integrase catalytic domain-containing protein n=1 Tax=Sesamum latifolium TaxID=2727402 RepID=A0AAW2UI17_9LAMI